MDDGGCKEKIKQARKFSLNFHPEDDIIASFLAREAGRGQCSTTAILFHVLAGASTCMANAQIEVDMLGLWKERPLVWAVIVCRKDDRSYCFPGSYTKSVMRSLEQGKTKQRKILPRHQVIRSKDELTISKRLYKQAEEKMGSCNKTPTPDQEVCDHTSEDQDKLAEKTGSEQKDMKSPDPSHSSSDMAFQNEMAEKVNTDIVHNSSANDTSSPIDPKPCAGSEVAGENHQQPTLNIQRNPIPIVQDLERVDNSKLDTGSSKYFLRSFDTQQTPPNLLVDETSLPTFIKSLRQLLIVESPEISKNPQEQVNSESNSESAAQKPMDLNRLVVLGPLMFALKEFPHSAVLNGFFGDMSVKYFLNSLNKGISVPNSRGVFLNPPRLNLALTLPNNFLCAMGSSSASSELLDSVLLTVTKDPPIILPQPGVESTNNNVVMWSMDDVLDLVHQRHNEDCGKQEVIYKFSKKAQHALKRQFSVLASLKSLCDESDDERGYAFIAGAEIQLVRLSALFQALRNALSSHKDQDLEMRETSGSVEICETAVDFAFQVTHHSLLHKCFFYAKHSTYNAVRNSTPEPARATQKQSRHHVEKTILTAESRNKETFNTYCRDKRQNQMPPPVNNNSTETYSTMRKQLKEDVIIVKHNTVPGEKRAYQQDKEQHPMNGPSPSERNNNGISEKRRRGGGGGPELFIDSVSPPMRSLLQSPSQSNSTTDVKSPVSSTPSAPKRRDTSNTLSLSVQSGSTPSSRDSSQRVQSPFMVISQPNEDSEEENSSRKQPHSPPVYIKNEVLDPTDTEALSLHALNAVSENKSLILPPRIQGLWTPDSIDLRFQPNEEFLRLASSKICKLMLCPILTFQMSFLCQRRFFPPIPMHIRGTKPNTSHPVWAATYFACRLTALGLGYIAHPTGRHSSVVFVKYPWSQMSPMGRMALQAVGVEELEYKEVYESSDPKALQALEAVGQEELENIVSQVQIEAASYTGEMNATMSSDVFWGPVGNI